MFPGGQIVDFKLGCSDGLDIGAVRADQQNRERQALAAEDHDGLENRLSRFACIGSDRHELCERTPGGSGCFWGTHVLSFYSGFGGGQTPDLNV